MGLLKKRRQTSVTIIYDDEFIFHNSYEDLVENLTKQRKAALDPLSFLRKDSYSIILFFNWRIYLNCALLMPNAIKTLNSFCFQG